jgi:hypothetical protein
MPPAGVEAFDFLWEGVRTKEYALDLLDFSMGIYCRPPVSYLLCAKDCTHIVLAQLLVHARPFVFSLNIIFFVYIFHQAISPPSSTSEWTFHVSPSSLESVIRVVHTHPSIITRLVIVSIYVYHTVLGSVCGLPIPPPCCSFKKSCTTL